MSIQIRLRCSGLHSPSNFINLYGIMLLFVLQAVGALISFKGGMNRWSLLSVVTRFAGVIRFRTLIIFLCYIHNKFKLNAHKGISPLFIRMVRVMHLHAIKRSKVTSRYHVICSVMAFIWMTQAVVSGAHASRPVFMLLFIYS